MHIDRHRYLWADDTVVCASAKFRRLEFKQSEQVTRAEILVDSALIKPASFERLLNKLD